MSYIDEQAGERCHKRYKHARPFHARKTSPEDNLLDIMRLSLAWSDPKLSTIDVMLAKPNHETIDNSFAKKMAEFYEKPKLMQPEDSSDADADDESDDEYE